MIIGIAFELLAAVLLLGVGWLWFDSLRAREAAIAAARRACAGDGVLLLDDTVALVALRPRRNGRGAIVLMRAYQFEFSDTGNNRLEGSVSLLGSAVQTIYLEPHAGMRTPPPLSE